MPNTFYAFPPAIDALKQKQSLRKISAADSVWQNINLILMTKWNECRYDPEFGCGVWEEDYSNIASLTAWKDDAEVSINRSLLAHEKRLRDLRVRLEIEEPVEMDKKGNALRIRKRMSIIVSGILIETDERLTDMEFTMYLSPISMD